MGSPHGEELGALFEPAVQRVVDTSSIMVTLTSYTYWLSQFAVVGMTLLWVYFRHHERFAGFRNWLIVANLVGLVGYVLMPTAPPRMFPEWGFVDTLAQYSSINHDSGLIAFAANPYAAMPSLHAMDALIVGIVMFGLVRSRLAKAFWLAWPALGRVRGHLDREPLLARRRRGFPLAIATGLALRAFAAAPPARMTDDEPAPEPLASTSSTASSRSTRRPRARSCSARCAGSRRRS